MSQQTRYFLFNRKTLEKTGEYKAIKNVQTREEAREYKRQSAQVLGIFDRWNQTATS